MTVAPFVAALLIMLVPSNRPWLTRLIALGASLVSFAISLVVLAGYSWQAGGFQFRETYQWLPQFGVQVLLGVDGISVPMVFLNAIVLLTGTIVTFKIADRPKEFYALFLVSVAGVFGVFCSVDLFVLFLWTLAEHDLEHAVSGFGRLAVDQRNKVRRKDEWGFGWRDGREERTRQIDSRTRSFDLAHFEIVHEQC